MPLCGSSPAARAGAGGRSQHKAVPAAAAQHAQPVLLQAAACSCRQPAAACWRGCRRSDSGSAGCGQRTVHVHDREGGAEVAEDIGEDAAGLSADERDGRRVLVADLVDARRLLQAAVRDHHHLRV